MASPPTINLLSEIFLLGGVIGYDKLIFLVLPVGSFLGAVFTIFLFSFSQHGKINYSKKGFWGVVPIEYHRLIMHVLPLNFLIFKFDVFFIWL